MLGFLRLAFIAVKFKMMQNTNRFGFKVIFSSNQHVLFPIWVLCGAESPDLNLVRPFRLQHLKLIPHPSNMNRQNTRGSKCCVADLSFDSLLNKHRRAELLSRLQLLFWTSLRTKGRDICLKTLTARFVTKEKKEMAELTGQLRALGLHWQLLSSLALQKMIQMTSMFVFGVDKLLFAECLKKRNPLKGNCV